MTAAPDLARVPALVLCGGLGTRLRSVVTDVPKVLAPVAGRPFLDVLAGMLHAAGMRRVVLCTGYLSEHVERYVDTSLRRAFPDLELTVSRESEPLGTAGAVKLAERFVDGTFFVLNGDTYFELDAAGLLSVHRRAGALVTMAGVRVPDTSRYGALELADDGAIRAFREKGGPAGPGLVNAGAYVAEPGLLGAIPAGRKVSLERDVFPALVAAGEPVHAAPQTGRFIDIGTAETWAELSQFLMEQSP